MPNATGDTEASSDGCQHSQYRLNDEFPCFFFHNVYRLLFTVYRFGSYKMELNRELFACAGSYAS
jgi:hypothetical protein